MERPNQSGASGFTLIEIALAILILASSLVVLMGLQASTVQQALQDRNGQQAMLIAREILSAIEITKDPAALQDFTGSPEETLKNVLGGNEGPKTALDPAQQFDVDLKFTKVELPNLGSDRLRRCTLAIKWPGAPGEGFVIDYFIGLEK